ncbi:MAG: DUF4199 domain-containing protein [Vicingaceae bacterium]
MKKYSIEIKWALIFVVVTLLWMWMEKLVGLHSEYIEKHMIYTNFFMIPAILVYVLALREKGRVFYNGTMTYMQGFISGLVITLIVTIFSPLTQWIISYVITPEYFPNVIEAAVRLEYMTQEEAEAYFTFNNYVLQSLMYAPIMGIITTAIVAIFTRGKTEES